MSVCFTLLTIPFGLNDRKTTVIDALEIGVIDLMFFFAVNSHTQSDNKKKEFK